MTEIICKDDDCINNKLGMCSLDTINLIYGHSFPGGLICEQQEDMILDFETLQLKKA